MNDIAKTCLYLKGNNVHVLVEIYNKFLADMHDHLCYILNYTIQKTFIDYNSVVDFVEVAPYGDFRMGFYNDNTVTVLWTNEIFKNEEDSYFLARVIYDVFTIWAESSKYFQDIVDEYKPIFTGLELNLL